MALHVVLRRHERQVNPVNNLLAKLHGGRSTGPKSAAALDALKAKMTKHGWFGQEAVAARDSRSPVACTPSERPHAVVPWHIGKRVYRAKRHSSMGQKT